MEKQLQIQVKRSRMRFDRKSPATGVLKRVLIFIAILMFSGAAAVAQPTVVSVMPFGDVYRSDGNVVITFSEPMDEMTVGAVQLNSLPALAGGSWSAGSTVFTIPFSGLTDGSYTVNISGFKNAGGTVMVPDGTHGFETKPWQLCPGTLPPPTVARSVVYYQQGGSEVDISSDIGASMSVAADYLYWRYAGTSPTDPGTVISPPKQSLASAGTFYFWVTQVQSSPGACGEIQITVIVGEAPRPIVHETSVCKGEPLTVILATLVDPNPEPFEYELVWYTSLSGAGSLTPPDPASINTDVAGEQFVYVTYRKIFEPTVESMKEPIKITVAPLADITNNTGTTVLTCNTPNISLTATGGVNYAWDNGLGSNADAIISTPGTYTVTVTSAGGCTNTASITITENIASPTLSLTASQAYYGDNITLTATLAAGCNPTGTITFFVNGSSTDVQPATGNGVYTFVLINPNTNNYDFQVTYSGDTYNNPAMAMAITGFALLPKPLTVTYEANGGIGTLTDPNNPYVAGDKVTVLEHGSMIKPYMIFTVWNTQSNGKGTSYPEGAIFKITGDITLYAQWDDNFVMPLIQRLISIAPTTNGRVTSDRMYSRTGEIISLTITPSPGYILDEIIVYSTDNWAITFPVVGEENVRTFRMPPNTVTVKATFTQSTGVETQRIASLQAWTQNGVLYINGVKAGDTWHVYTLPGTLIYQGVANGETAKISLPARGVYIVTDGKNVLKIIN